MRGKLVIAGMSLFLGLSSLYAQDNPNQLPLEPRYIQVDQKGMEFYARINSLDKKEIIELYKQSPDLFYQKYKNYNRGTDVNPALDAKVFEALGDAFLCHNFLDLEEKVNISESGAVPILLFPRKMVNSNHALTILLYNYILQKVDRSEPSQQTLEGIYSDLKETIRFNKNPKLMPEDILVNYGISNVKLDSFQLSVVYYDIGKVIGADFSPVRVRDKFYIKYEDNKFFNPLDGITYSQDQIIKYNADFSEGMKNQIFLKPLTKDQMTAIEFARFGWSNVMSMKRERLKLDDFIKGLKEVPYLLKKDPKGIEDAIKVFVQNAGDLRTGAEHCFTSALSRDESAIEVYAFRGQLHNMTGDNFYDPEKTEITSIDFGKWDLKLIESSINDFQKIIKLDPGDWRGYELLGFAYYDKATFSIHLHDFDIGDLYVQKAQDAFAKSHELKGDEEPEEPVPPPKNTPSKPKQNTPTA